MNVWLEKQRHLIDFTLASLARRKTKNLGLLLAYSVLVFVLASLATRGARFFLVAALVRRFGTPIRGFVERRLTLATTIFAVVLVGGFVALRYGLPS